MNYDSNNHLNGCTCNICLETKRIYVMEHKGKESYWIPTDRRHKDKSGGIIVEYKG